MPELGTQFAGYRLETVVGRGGMGVVYLARDPRLDRPVALKLLTPELAGDQQRADPVDRWFLTSQHPGTPLVEPLGLGAEAGAAGPVGDEGAVPEPAEPVGREVR